MSHVRNAVSGETIAFSDLAVPPLLYPTAYLLFCDTSRLNVMVHHISAMKQSFYIVSCGIKEPITFSC